MGVAQRHGAVMLEFLATETIARRIVLERYSACIYISTHGILTLCFSRLRRLVLMLDAEEQAIDLVCDVSVCTFVDI